jgi:hypothetical protein
MFGMTHRTSAPLAVAVVAFVVLGCQSVATATVAPSTRAPASVAASQAAAETPVDYTRLPGGGAELAPGSYVITFLSPLRVTFTVPDGWYKGSLDWAIFENDSKASMSFGTPADLEDPCRQVTREPAVGPTVADLVTALGSVPGLRASPPSDVTLGGYAGKGIDLMVSDPGSACEGALWNVTGNEAVPAPGPGTRLSLSILDVDGTRLVVAARMNAEADADTAAQVQGILGSIRIDGS